MSNNLQKERLEVVNLMKRVDKSLAEINSVNFETNDTIFEIFDIDELFSRCEEMYSHSKDDLEAHGMMLVLSKNYMGIVEGKWDFVPNFLKAN